MICLQKLPFCPCLCPCVKWSTMYVKRQTQVGKVVFMPLLWSKFSLYLLFTLLFSLHSKWNLTRRGRREEECKRKVHEKKLMRTIRSPSASFPWKRSGNDSKLCVSSTSTQTIQKSTWKRREEEEKNVTLVSEETLNSAQYCSLSALSRQEILKRDWIETAGLILASVFTVLSFFAESLLIHQMDSSPLVLCLSQLRPLHQDSSLLLQTHHWQGNYRDRDTDASVVRTSFTRRRPRRESEEEETPNQGLLLTSHPIIIICRVHPVLASSSSHSLLQ